MAHIWPSFKCINEKERGAPFLARFLREKWGCSSVTDKFASTHHSVLMPRGLIRYYGSGDLHFITCSCYHRLPLLASAKRRNLFLTVLEQIRKSYSFVILGYVLMPEHFHLLISEPQRGTPSKVIQALKVGFVRRLLKRPNSQAQFDLWDKLPACHIWQRRFYDFNVWTERKRIEKLRYMHRNPVKRGLVEQPDHWRWSSFRSYDMARWVLCASTTGEF